MTYSNLVYETDDDLLNSYDYYRCLMFRTNIDEIRLGQIENELKRRNIEYDIDQALLSLFKGANNE